MSAFECDEYMFECGMNLSMVSICLNVESVYSNNVCLNVVNVLMCLNLVSFHVCV